MTAAHLAVGLSAISIPRAGQSVRMLCNPDDRLQQRCASDKARLANFDKTSPCRLNSLIFAANRQVSGAY